MQKLKVFSGCTEFGTEVQAFRDRGHKVTTLGMEGDCINLDNGKCHLGYNPGGGFARCLTLGPLYVNYCPGYWPPFNRPETAQD